MDLDSGKAVGCNLRTPRLCEKLVMAGPLEAVAVAVAAFVYRTGRTGLYFVPLG